MEEIRVKNGGFEISAFSRGRCAVKSVAASGDEVAFGRLSCGKFGELSALPEKWRRHDSGDQRLVEVDSTSVIPFGCEYRTVRHVEIFDGFSLVTTDVSPLNHGRITRLELEPVTFRGSWSRVEYLLYGADSFVSVGKLPAGERRELYRGRETVVMLRVVFDSGVTAEFAVGNDLWRHRASFHLVPGVGSEYSIIAGDDEITLERMVFDFPEEIEAPKRGWRFNHLLSWYDPAGRSAAVEGAAADTVISYDSCAIAPACRRRWRSALRSGEGSSCLLKDAAPHICFDPAHLERSGSGELEHFDLEELAELWLWGNRRREKGGFTVKAAEGSLFADSAAMKNLSSIPQVLS